MAFWLHGFQYLYELLLNTVIKGLSSEGQEECPLTLAEMLPVEQI